MGVKCLLVSDPLLDSCADLANLAAFGFRFDRAMVTVTQRDELRIERGARYYI
jgi:hypothetical protein